jgi:serine/threonine protein kinase
MTKATMGTYGYMAPEIINQQQFSKASDVYSFGIILAVLCSKVTSMTELYNYEPLELPIAILRKNARPLVPNDCNSDLQLIMKR